MLLEQVIAPYRQSPVQIEVEAEGEGEEPLAAHTPAILYGLGNFIENASDFARTKAIVGAKWSKDTVEICIVDDGPGFSNEVVDKIGEPYVTSSSKSSHQDRRGLGSWFGRVHCQDAAGTNRRRHKIRQFGGRRRKRSPQMEARPF